MSGVDGFSGRRAEEVLILGAGFSRAISAALPLTDELGGLAVERARMDGFGPIRHPEFRGGSFETWLSRLAGDQPHLSAAANLENRSLFSRIGQAQGAAVMLRRAGRHLQARATLTVPLSAPSVIMSVTLAE